MSKVECAAAKRQRKALRLSQEFHKYDLYKLNQLGMRISNLRNNPLFMGFDAGVTVELLEKR